MNETSQTQPNGIKLPKFLQWMQRHRQFYSALILVPSMILGTMPGLAMFLLFSLMQSHHVPLTTVQTILWAMAGVTLLAFGTLFGALVGCTVLIMERFVFPEHSPSKQ